MKNSIAQRVKKFYDIMIEENLSEMEYREGDFFIYLRRKTVASDKLLPVEIKQPTPKVEKESTQEQLKAQSINSPLNGVFYRASSPKSPPFVNEGDVVEKGGVLCIIEAMKVMNEIKADRRVKILKILVENSQPVTQGQPLFLVE